MTNKQDDTNGPDHVGWRLWQASQVWLDAFVAEMQAAGHGWFGRAQANVLGHLDREGTRQVVLAERLGLSKQAVQQLLDDLTEKGIVHRVPDPADRRAKIVRYTRKGAAALRDADRIKGMIERGFAERLGRTEMATLMRLLTRLAEDRE